MTSDSPTLEFQCVDIENESAFDTGLQGASFSVQPGTLVHVTVGEHENRHPLFDAAQGLLVETSGTVRFESAAWRETGPTDAAGMRSRMGRVFRDGAWLNNLDVDENITLKLRHHTRRSDAEIREEAEALAVRLGLDGLPGERPAWIGRSVLKRAQWVRALLGSPRLVLLDYPARDVETKYLEAFYDALRDAMQNGAGILWVSADSESIRDAQLQPAAEYRIVSGVWTGEESKKS